MNNQILITGGSGFIGTNLVNYLLKKNYFVTNIDKQSYASTPENFKLKNKKYSFYKVNISNQKKIEKILLKNFSIIIHLAAESHVDRSIDNPKKFIKSNINSTLNLYSSILKLRKNKKIKNPNIIHISTDEVYGSIKKESFLESSTLCTSSPYSASKASCDHIAECFQKTFNFNICILRMTNNYGPFQFIEKFIPTIITKILENKKIPLYGNGNNEREWIFVEDTCRAIEKVIIKFKKKKIYNMGSGERIKNKIVIKNILNKFKIKNHNKLIINVKDRPGHDLRYALNSKNFQEEYAWKPKYKFSTGIIKTIKWFIDNPEWVNYCKKKYKGNRIGIV
jgi:dTDP-glucose 4,6-dehydratase